MKRILFLVIFATICSGVCAQQNSYRTVENIAYRTVTGDTYTDQQCRLDLYYPDEVKEFATIVWFHGGGLTGGGKEIPEALKNKGFAIVGVGYRLTPQVTVTQCIEDAAAAAAWTVNHIAEYGGDPQRIFIAGHSAGGYLTSMIGLDKRWMAPYGIDPDSAFAALIPYSGQAITHFAHRKELGLPDTQPLIDDLAPLYHVHPSAPPMLVLSGDREQEMLGRYEENAYFCRMMKVAGHKDIILHEFDGFDHGNMADPGHLVAVRYIRNFLKNHTK